jgi:hypothetical protein
VALTLRAPPPPSPVSPSQALDSVPAAPGRDSGGESEDSNASHGTGGQEGEEEEAARNRTLLLEAIHQFSKQWRVTPHVFFMLGKSVSDPRESIGAIISSDQNIDAVRREDKVCIIK